MTTRGFRELEVEQLANLLADVLDASQDEKNLARVADDVKQLCARFPAYA